MQVINTPEWKHEAVCTGCRSELLIEAADVKYGQFGGGYCESGDATWFARCCVCEEPIFLFGHGEMKEYKVWIPKQIMDKARDEYEKRNRR